MSRVCRLAKLARERHKRDLKEGPGRGLWFDRDAVKWVELFFRECLVHVEGEWAGKPFELAEWQHRDIITPLFGWKKLPAGMTGKEAQRLGGGPGVPLHQRVKRRLEAGIYRRYRKAYLEVARKNGKSTLFGGMGLYFLCADFEPGAKIVNAATKFDQAKIIHGTAMTMVKKSPILSKHLKLVSNVIIDDRWNATFKPLGRDSDTEDGLNPSAALIDEYHAHAASGMYDVLATAQGARRQPLLGVITTAGFDKQGPCYKERAYAVQVLEGYDDDGYFACIYTLDDEAEAENPKAWVKANPGLGVSPSREYIEQQVREAQAKAGYRHTVWTKNFNLWLDSAVGWLDMRRWRACSTAVGLGQQTERARAWRAAALEVLRGRECYAGLDLGSTSDVTALVLLFDAWEGWEAEVRERMGEEEAARSAAPPIRTNTDGHGQVEGVEAEGRPQGSPLPEGRGSLGFIALPWFWVPEDGSRDRDQRNAQSYARWIEEGFIATTEGNATDYDAVRMAISGWRPDGTMTGQSLADAFGVRELAIDRAFQGTQIAMQLMSDGVDVVAYGQGFLSMAAPTKRLEELVLLGQLDHGSNPVLEWMARNVTVKRDPAGNMKMDKEKSGEKIDGMVALAMALGRRIAREELDRLDAERLVVMI